MWIYLLLIFTTLMAVPTLTLVGFGVYLRYRGKRFILDDHPLVLDLTQAKGVLDYCSAGMHLNFETGSGDMAAVKVIRNGSPVWVRDTVFTLAMRLSLLGENFDIPGKIEGK